MSRNASTTRESGVPLHQIDRRLWPSLTFHPAEPRRTIGGVLLDKIAQTGVATLVPNAPAYPPPAVRLEIPPAPAEEIAAAEGPGSTEEEVQKSEIAEQQVSEQTASVPPAPAHPCSPARNLGGRPRALTDPKREVLLRLLRQGDSRRKAAKGAGVAPSTIWEEIHRDARFAQALRDAEEEGREFRRVFKRLFEPGLVRLERCPVISTPQFEQEKAFLISKGLSREWVSRMRLVTTRELKDFFAVAEISKRAPYRKGLLADLERARNSLCGEEIVEERFSADGRRRTVLKTRRRLPPDESVLAGRVASLEMALDMPPDELNRLLAAMEQDSEPKKKTRKRTKSKLEELK
jgi:hypothetical protein